MTWKQMNSRVSSNFRVLDGWSGASHSTHAMTLSDIWYISVRRWRQKSTLGGQGQWQVEVGLPNATPVTSSDSVMIKESCLSVGFLLFLFFPHILTLELQLTHCMLSLDFNPDSFKWKHWNCHILKVYFNIFMSTACVHATRLKRQLSVENPPPSLS